MKARKQLQYLYLDLHVGNDFDCFVLTSSLPPQKALQTVLHNCSIARLDHRVVSVSSLLAAAHY